MKKITLLFASCISILGASAQITINSTDVAPGYKTFYNATDTLVASSMIGFAGASQSWNMTTLNADSKDTLNFLPYSSRPNSNFTNANSIMKQGYNNYAYLDHQWNVLNILGYVGNFGGATATLKNKPAEIMMNFPSAYGNAPFTNNFKTTGTFYYGKDPGIGIVIDSIRVNTHVKKTQQVDAWGTLSTPFPGGPYSVLRVKETKITHDTTDAFFLGAWANGVVMTADSITTYAWWAKNIGIPLATATMDSVGGVTQMEWLSGTLVGINENTAAITDVNVYPNPAQNEITFAVDMSKAAIIQIVDITGRLISTSIVKNDNPSINTSAFTNGVYFYSIIGVNNSTLHNGKFTVSK